MERNDERGTIAQSRHDMDIDNEHQNTSRATGFAGRHHLHRNPVSAQERIAPAPDAIDAYLKLREQWIDHLQESPPILEIINAKAASEEDAAQCAP